MVCTSRQITWRKHPNMQWNFEGWKVHTIQWRVKCLIYSVLMRYCSKFNVMFTHLTMTCLWLEYLMLDTRYLLQTYLEVLRGKLFARYSWVKLDLSTTFASTLDEPWHTWTSQYSSHEDWHQHLACDHLMARLIIRGLLLRKENLHRCINAHWWFIVLQ